MEGHVNLWKPEYLLDIEVIDEQHKGFFDICLSIAQTADLSRSDPEHGHGVIQALYQLRKYAFRHFQTEEDLLLKHSYPWVYEHITLHDHFLQMLRDATGQMHAKLNEEGQGFRELAQTLAEFTATWWSVHIMTADRKYAAHLAANHRRGGAGVASQASERSGSASSGGEM